MCWPSLRCAVTLHLSQYEPPILLRCQSLTTPGRVMPYHRLWQMPMPVYSARSGWKWEGHCRFSICSYVVAVYILKIHYFGFILVWNVNNLVGVLWHYVWNITWTWHYLAISSIVANVRSGTCRQLTRILQPFGHHTEGWWQTDKITGQILTGQSTI